uniref:Regulatory protein E2 n=1 Tax=Bat papillomavirus TaxID=2004707 RepID=A0A2Z2JJ28_9PAPI|nr:E2 [Bat papillomavirus]
MQKLQDRLDSTQETQLKIYEKDTKSIRDLIIYWDAVERENLLLYAARQKGISHIGITVVPPRQVSEERAKDAIKMKLVLESLADSPFGREEWTFTDVTIERYMTNPSQTFKKDPKIVRVNFDGDPENANLYTGWGKLYFPTDSGWKKTKSYVTHRGIFYVDEDGNNVYYVEFDNDAQLYSSSAYYEVYYKDKLVDLQKPVPLSPVPPGGDTSKFSVCRGPSSRGSACSPHLGTEGRTRETFVSPPQKRVRWHEPPSPAKVSSGVSHKRSPRQVPGSASTPPHSPNKRGGRRRGRPSRGRSSPALRSSPGSPSGVRRAASAVSGGGASSPVPASRVGRNHQTPPRGAGGRLERLIAEAQDPPVICLSGTINSLKAYRSRCKAQYSKYFVYISTTFNVQYADVPRKLPLGRLLIYFSNTEQRELFLQKVRIPVTIRVVLGNINGNP